VPAAGQQPAQLAGAYGSGSAGLRDSKSATVSGTERTRSLERIVRDDRVELQPERTACTPLHPDREHLDTHDLRNKAAGHAVSGRRVVALHRLDVNMGRSFIIDAEFGRLSKAADCLGYSPSAVKAPAQETGRSSGNAAAAQGAGAG
jgi:hypothetical protein